MMRPGSLEVSVEPTTRARRAGTSLRVVVIGLAALGSCLCTSEPRNYGEAPPAQSGEAGSSEGGAADVEHGGAPGEGGRPEAGGAGHSGGQGGAPGGGLGGEGSFLGGTGGALGEGGGALGGEGGALGGEGASSGEGGAGESGAGGAGRSKVEEIAAGAEHTCALRDGAVYCWGKNDKGQLGRKTEDDADPRPAIVDGIQGRVTAVSAGGKHTCAIAEGVAWCWGSNETGQLGISIGTTHTVAPQKVEALSPGVPSIDAGATHTCAVLEYASGSAGAWCWGSNRHGELGVEPTNDPAPPVAVSDLPNGNVLAVAASKGFSPNSNQSHSCALVVGQAMGAGGTGSAGGAGPSVWCWGASAHKQVIPKDGSAEVLPPRQAQAPTTAEGFSAVAAGEHFTCAIESQVVSCWGNNSENRIVGPVNRKGSQIALGAAHGCAIQTIDDISDQVVCWGRNAQFQLGFEGPSEPTAFRVDLPRARISRIAAGGTQTCAIVDDSIYCWGTWKGDTTTTAPERIELP